MVRVAGVAPQLMGGSNGPDLFEVHVPKSVFVKSVFVKSVFVKSALAIAVLALALGTSSVQAQRYDPRYPICIHVFGELEGERMDCIFTSIPQCQAAASGRPAMCIINPYFVPASRSRRQ